MKKIVSILLTVILLFTLCSCSGEAKPVYAEDLNEGTYSIDVKSSSSMFRIVDCEITVKENKMTAEMTLSGQGYEKLCMNATRETADSFSEDDYSYFREGADGRYSYEVDVEALDKEVSCAAFSIKKQKWYDRTLVFESETLPEGAVKTDNSVLFLTIVIIGVIFISAAILAVIIIKRKKRK